MRLDLLACLLIEILFVYWYGNNLFRVFCFYTQLRWAILSYSKYELFLIRIEVLIKILLLFLIHYCAKFRWFCSWFSLLFYICIVDVLSTNMRFYCVEMISCSDELFTLFVWAHFNQFIFKVLGFFFTFDQCINYSLNFWMFTFNSFTLFLWIKKF